MRYVLKVGDRYIGSDGMLTDSQSDAIKIDDMTPGDVIRKVRLRPHGSLPTRAGSSSGIDSSPDPRD